jgi:hypothetical protein
MSKLSSKLDVIEWYWADYLAACMRSRDSKNPVFWKSPTIDGFWLWYIEDGPMGLKHQNLYYTEEKVYYI